MYRLPQNEGLLGHANYNSVVNNLPLTGQGGSWGLRGSLLEASVKMSPP